MGLGYRLFGITSTGTQVVKAMREQRSCVPSVAPAPSTNGASAWRMALRPIHPTLTAFMLKTTSVLNRLKIEISRSNPCL
jgi:hypothetical protein